MLSCSTITMHVERSLRAELPKPRSCRGGRGVLPPVRFRVGGHSIARDRLCLTEFAIGEPRMPRLDHQRGLVVPLTTKHLCANVHECAQARIRNLCQRMVMQAVLPCQGCPCCLMVFIRSPAGLMTVLHRCSGGSQNGPCMHLVCALALPKYLRRGAVPRTTKPPMAQPPRSYVEISLL
jgi:hypothetical protein